MREKESCSIFSNIDQTINVRYFFPQYGRHEQRQQRTETGGKSESYQTRAFFSFSYSTQVIRRDGRQMQRMDEICHRQTTFQT